MNHANLSETPNNLHYIMWKWFVSSHQSKARHLEIARKWCQGSLLDDDHSSIYFKTLHTVMASISYSNRTEKYADTQRTTQIGAVDEIEVGVVLSADDRMI